LTGLSSDWEFKERMKWREDVPRLPGLRRRTGRELEAELEECLARPRGGG